MALRSINYWLITACAVTGFGIVVLSVSLSDIEPKMVDNPWLGIAAIAAGAVCFVLSALPLGGLSWKGAAIRVLRNRLRAERLRLGAKHIDPSRQDADPIMRESSRRFWKRRKERWAQDV